LRIPIKRRKAISPVLATVILIAITLIAAIAIAGFVFGLFGSFTSSAQVSASVLHCYVTGGTAPHNATNNCLVNLTNTGTSNVGVTSCSIHISGSAVTGTMDPSTATVGASSSRLTGCQAAGAAQTIGSQVVGSYSLSNGATVAFSSVWS